MPESFVNQLVKLPAFTGMTWNWDTAGVLSAQPAPGNRRSAAGQGAAPIPPCDAM